MTSYAATTNKVRRLYSQWRYQGYLTITNPVTQVNFQHQLTLAWLPGMRADFADIRFTQINGLNCPYAIETYTSGVSATITLKVPDAGQGGLYIFWGNPGAASASSPVDVYLQYHGAATGSYQDPLVLSPAAGIIFECYIQPLTSHNILFGAANNYLVDDGMWIQSYTPGAKKYIQVQHNGTPTYTAVTGSLSLSTYHRLRIVLSPTNARFYVDGGEIGSAISTNLPTDTLGLSVSLSTGTYMQEWAFARLYAATEPTLTLTNVMPNMTAGQVIPMEEAVIHYDRVLSVRHGTGLYADWMYSALIAVTNPVTQVNFQHQLTLAWLPGMRADFADIRFTQQDGTDCPYWIRSDNIINFTSCEVWIKVPSASQGLIRMYWGNGMCSSGSSIDNTFDFGDDFNGAAIDTSKWTVAGNPTVSGGICSLVSAGSSVSISSNANISPDPGIVMVRLKSKHFQNTTYREYALLRIIGANFAGAQYSYTNPTDGMKYQNYTGTSIYDDITGWVADTYYVQALKSTGSVSIWTVDGGSSVSQAGNYPAGAGAVGFYATTAAGAELHIDWIAVRKYSATEPTLTISVIMPNPDFRRYVWTDGNRAGDCSFGVQYGLVVTSNLLGLAIFGVNYGFIAKGDLIGNAVFTVRYGFLVNGKVVTLVQNGLQGSLMISGSSTRDLNAKVWTTKVKYTKAGTGGPTSTIFDQNIEISVPDHNGVNRPVFVGFYPSQTADYTPGNKWEEFTGYSDDHYLQYIIRRDELLLLKAPEDQDSTNYQRLDFDSTVYNFTTGKMILGSVSNATARIVGTRQQWIYGADGESYYVPENAIVLTEIVGTFIDNETITEIGGSGEALVNGSALIPLDFGAAVMYPEDWIRQVLGGDEWATTTGIYPYRLNPVNPTPVDPIIETWTVKPAVQWQFQSEETIQQAIDDMRKYHNFFFIVKWRGLFGPIHTPCAYFVHQDDIDNPSDYALEEHRGLDLPDPVTVTYPDPQLLEDVTCRLSGDTRYNQVIIRCQDPSSRQWYESVRRPGITESEGVYYGDERPRPYPNIVDQNLVSQADCDDAAELLYTYLSLRLATYEATFTRRTDLEYLQKMIFTGHPDIPDDTYRIVGIAYKWATADILVPVTLIPDSQFAASLAVNRLYDNSTNEVRNIILNELAKLPQIDVGTFETANGNKIIGKNEAGQKLISRNIS